MNRITQGLTFGLQLYRRISAGGIARCRFYPTCSAYTVEALEQEGLAKGLRRSFFRLLRCHPWHAGGYDPVVSYKEN